MATAAAAAPVAAAPVAAAPAAAPAAVPAAVIPAATHEVKLFNKWYGFSLRGPALVPAHTAPLV